MSELQYPTVNLIFFTVVKMSTGKCRNVRKKGWESWREISTYYSECIQFKLEIMEFSIWCFPVKNTETIEYSAKDKGKKFWNRKYAPKAILEVKDFNG